MFSLEKLLISKDFRFQLLGRAAGLTLLALLALSVSAQPQGGNGAIEGVVQSSKGSEAGVWVIAETDDLPTHFIKIVVTDDDGRFVLPELPDALYTACVLGCGLVA